MPDASRHDQSRARHWERVWTEKSPEATSWFQRDPAISVAMIGASGISPSRPLIDVGGGASLLVDRLLELGYADVSVLDIAAEAMEHARGRLGGRSDAVSWITADVTDWEPARRYALWHDRAVFHFLTDPDSQAAYSRALRAALEPDGQAIIATFSLDGPETCSGLPVRRHDAASLLSALGGGLVVLETRTEDHRTPAGGVQRFFWCRLGRRD